MKDLLAVNRDSQSAEHWVEDEDDLQLWRLDCVLEVVQVDEGLEW